MFSGYCIFGVCLFLRAEYSVSCKGPWPAVTVALVCNRSAITATRANFTTVPKTNSA